MEIAQDIETKKICPRITLIDTNKRYFAVENEKPAKLFFIRVYLRYSQATKSKFDFLPLEQKLCRSVMCKKGLIDFNHD
jgi:hypothetical protein